MVLAARNFDSGNMFQKLKMVQKRYGKNIVSSPPKDLIQVAMAFYNNENIFLVAGSLILISWV